MLPVWVVIDLIAQETKNFNEQQGKGFDVAKSIATQIVVNIQSKLPRDLQISRKYNLIFEALKRFTEREIGDSSDAT